MTLGDYIKAYRKIHQCSMDDFARSSGLSKAYISILERNYNPSTKKAAIPSLDTIKRVAAATGTDFNELLAALDNDQEVSLRPEKAEVATPPNTIRIAGRDGSYHEQKLTDEQMAALKAILDQMPDVPDDL